MTEIIGNAFLTATVSHKGGELLSLRSTKDGREYIWNGDQAVWKWHAPVLFPQCGNFPQGYIHEGRRRFLPIHGFLRDMEHTYQGDGKFVLSFPGNEEYPFSFEASTYFIPHGSSLIHRVEILNASSSALPCSLGFHTGYAIKRAEIEFEKEEEEIGGRYFKCTDASITETVLLTKIKSRTFLLKGEEGKRLRISSPYFSTLVIWSPKGHSCDFVSVEPRVDTVSSGAKEPFAMELPTGQTLTLEERIEILD